MQLAIREELTALRKMAAEFHERLERLAQWVETEEGQKSAEPKLSLIEEFQQKYPNLPVPRLLRYAASQNPPPNPIEDYKQAIRDAVAEKHLKRYENSD
jgi:hypothetical protein